MNRDSIDFENGQVSVLFRKLLIPTLLGTLAMSAVVAIDGIFIGHGVGVEGVAAVNIVLPTNLIISGIGLMLGIACSVVSSVHSSHQNLKAARLNITQSIAISTIFSLLLLIVTSAFPKQIALLLGASDTLIPQVLDYMKWIMPSFFVSIVECNRVVHHPS